MIPARENAPRHRVPNLYRFDRLSLSHITLSLSLCTFRFSLKNGLPRGRAKDHGRDVRFFEVEIQN